MFRYLQLCLLVGLGFLAVTGCNDKPGVPAAVQQSNGDGAKYLLASEPAGAKAIMDLRKEAKDGDEVVVAGRIGGSKEPMVKGRAAFTIVDASIKPCEEEGDDCAWDYCCTPTEELAQATTLIKFVDESDKTIATDARQLLGVKELQMVVVRGKARRDEAGNFTVLASGLHVKQ